MYENFNALMHLLISRSPMSRQLHLLCGQLRVRGPGSLVVFRQGLLHGSIWFALWPMIPGVLYWSKRNGLKKWKYSLEYVKRISTVTELKRHWNRNDSFWWCTEEKVIVDTPYYKLIEPSIFSWKIRWKMYLLKIESLLVIFKN